MRVYISSDEWYPVYEASADDDFGVVVEITDAEWEDCTQAFVNFEKWQQILERRAHPK